MKPGVETVKFTVIRGRIGGMSESSKLPLLTPCCGAKIVVSVSGFSDEVEIYCPADGCYQEWNDKGEPQ